jgi:hypothetical protein
MSSSNTMFKLVLLFKDNQDFNKIAIALDCAYAKGALDTINKQLPTNDVKELENLITEKLEKLNH